MGKYFLMSTHFNKQSARDFGLIEKGNNTAVNPDDSSVWIAEPLYDFGWGSENGYYKAPLPGFTNLISIVLHSEDDEDVLGSAAIIEKKYPENLLDYCERLMADKDQIKDFKKLDMVFALHRPINRCPVKGKAYADIVNDSERWRKLSEYVLENLEEHKGKHSGGRRYML